MHFQDQRPNKTNKKNPRCSNFTSSPPAPLPSWPATSPSRPPPRRCPQPREGRAREATRTFPEDSPSSAGGKRTRGPLAGPRRPSGARRGPRRRRRRRLRPPPVLACLAPPPPRIAIARGAAPQAAVARPIGVCVSASGSGCCSSPAHLAWLAAPGAEPQYPTHAAIQNSPAARGCSRTYGSQSGASRVYTRGIPSITACTVGGAARKGTAPCSPCSAWLHIFAA